MTIFRTLNSAFKRPTIRQRNELYRMPVVVVLMAEMATIATQLIEKGHATGAFARDKDMLPVMPTSERAVAWDPLGAYWAARYRVVTERDDFPKYTPDVVDHCRYDAHHLLVHDLAHVIGVSGTATVAHYRHRTTEDFLALLSQMIVHTPRERAGFAVSNWARNISRCADGMETEQLIKLMWAQAGWLVECALHANDIIPTLKGEHHA